MQLSLSTNMRRWLLLVVVSLGSILLIWTPPSIVSSKTQAKMPQTRTRKFENYDIRDEERDRQAVMARRGLQNATTQEDRSKLGETMKVAQGRLVKQKSNLDVEWNKKVGAPEIVCVLSAQEKLTGRSSNNRSDIVRQFIADNHDLYGLTLDDVAQLKTTADYTNPRGNISWVELEQQINGIPVFQGNLRAGLTKDGELIRTTGLLVPGLSVGGNKRTKNQLSISSSASSGTTAAEAVAVAAASIGVSINPADLVVKEASGDGTWYVFEHGPFVEDIKVEETYFPLDSGAVTLSWSMILWQDVPAYYTLVDAQGGDLLWRKNITSDQTQSATYSIYNDDSPAPFSPFVGFPGSSIQGAGISRTTITNISELPAFDNLGWITDGGNTTTGNNVDAGLDVVAPNGIDPGSRPIGSPARVFDFPYNPPPLGSDPPTGTSYRAGAVTNLFFWANRYHDIIYQYGFTEPARNFQINNFGRGGLGNDFVRAEAQDFSGLNNANFSAPPDGSLPRMQMFLFAGSSLRRDTDLDQEIVLHELTHGTSSRLHNNSSGLQARISGGMGEGWSDFYSRMILSSADEDVDGIYSLAGYSTFGPDFGFTDNYYYGGRRYPYAVKTNVGPNGKPHNPLTFADIDPNQIDTSDGAFPFPFLDNTGYAATEVHNIGEVWCIALTEVRARVIHRMGYTAGNARMMQLTTDAMKLDPTNPTFVSGRNSLLAADVAFGSEDALDIWAGFATRGMGFGATHSGLAYVKESFDYPIPGMGTVTATDVPCNADGRLGVGEKLTLAIPLTNPLTNAITGVSAQVVGGGSATYGTIAAGSTVTQNISYQVPSDIACGSKVKIDVVVTSNLGTETKTFKLQVGTPTQIFSENFDGVTAPALPPGWTSSVTGTPTPPSWVTSTTAADSAPNAVSISFLPTTGLSELTSPSIAIPTSGAQLRFRHNLNSEFGWDGGVLEISINDGSFVDILTAGGSFELNGYDWAFFETFNGNTSVLQSRAGWTGNFGGFFTTIVNLPPSANGQNVRLKFRGASDSLNTVTNSQWRIDSIVINGFVCPGLATTTTVDAAAGQYSDSTTLSTTLASSCDYPEGSMEFRVDGVLVGTVPVSGTGVYSTPYVIANAAGSHTIAANFVSSNPYFQGSSSSNALTVSTENATATPFTGNPMAVQVSAPGGTASQFMLQADINEIADGSLGDISLAMPVSMTLTPVAPGSPITCATAVLSGGGIGGTLRAKCTFTNVAVNVYDVTIAIGGNYYSGSGGTVVTVFDPSLGFVSGGGVIIHDGNPANFGFNVRYKKNSTPQGQLLYIEHRPTGDIIVRGNVMQSLAILGHTAVFTGKGPVNGVGNYGFRVTVIDNGEAGTADQFGLQLTNPSGMIVGDMTFAPTTLLGGTIQVPH